jgi:hypothetical protein
MLQSRGPEIAMRIEREVSVADRVVVLRVIGALGDPELASLASEIRNAPGVEPDFSFLIDLRQADGRSVTSEGVRALAEQSLVVSQQSRRAVVVPSALGFGMARMYGMLREPGGGAVQVFHDFDEARRWVSAGAR